MAVIYERTTQHLSLIRLGESGWAVLEREDGQRFDFPADWLPEDAVVGDVIMLRRKMGRTDCGLRLFVNQKMRQERSQGGEANQEEGAKENATKKDNRLM